MRRIRILLRVILWSGLLVVAAFAPVERTRGAPAGCAALTALR